MQAAKRAGAHQFQRPSSRISAGTSRARTMVASSRTAEAVPSPSSFVITICEVRKAPNATAKSNAAEVTIRPVRSSPTAIASESS